ncbi:MAG: GDP-mannose 4,6-dehydratase [Burkholderiaceae bacterium]|nr:GDP-mannose 4,6-dehydratase [Burkholderiaceae bacterium]
MASLSDNGTTAFAAAARGRVLLTGVRGFTGRYLKAELEAAGYHVIGTVIGDAADAEIGLDITSLDACRQALEQVRPDYVVHLAAISFVQHESAEAFYRVNVVGTTNLLQALIDTKLAPRCVAIASSANIYGNTAGVLSESQAPQPVNHYAASKLAMEHMARTYADRLPIVLTRPFNYTGVNQDERFLVPKIVSHFAAGKKVIELGNLDVERDFSDVRVVARTYRALLENACAGETVNICSGQPHSLRAIIAMVQEIAGYEIDVRVNPNFVRASEVKTLVGSAGKLRSLIGEYAPIPLSHTLDWMYRAGLPQLNA